MPIIFFFPCSILYKPILWINYVPKSHVLKRYQLICQRKESWIFRDASIWSLGFRDIQGDFYLDKYSSHDYSVSAHAKHNSV